MSPDGQICQADGGGPLILNIAPWPAEQRVLAAENHAFRAAGRAARYAVLYYQLRHAARQLAAGRPKAAEQLEALIAIHEPHLVSLSSDAWGDSARGF